MHMPLFRHAFALFAAMLIRHAVSIRHAMIRYLRYDAGAIHAICHC